MRNPYLSTLLQMRHLVGFMGERAQFGWWPTSFHEASSRFFVEPVFSKTSKLTLYHGVTEAARRLHDEHLSVGCYHLFRLPEEVEQDLHALVLSPNGDEIVGKLPKNKDEALNAIKHFCPKVSKVVEGPTAIGSVRDIESPDTLKSIAGAYVSAFSRSTRVYPYLVV